MAKENNDSKIMWVMLCTLVSNSSYALIAPFLPLEFQDKGIKGELVGLIFSIYSVSVIFCSPFVGMAISAYGTRTIVTSGLALMGVTFLLFGLIDFMKDTTWILVYAMTLRLLQGASSAFIQTTCYSIATNDFPGESEKIVGWTEATAGIGWILGPIFGATLYSSFGFTNTFYVFGLFMLFLTCIVGCWFPTSGRVLPQEPLQPLGEGQGPIEEIDLESDHERPVIQAPSAGKLLCNARFTLAAGSSAMTYFVFSYMEPILAMRLKEFNLTSMQIGWFFSILPITYIPASILVQFVPSRIQKRVLIITCLLGNFVAFLFAGPSEIFHFPDNLVFMAIGQALIGIFCAIQLVPGLPEMSEAVLHQYPGHEVQTNNLTSGIFNSALGIGQVIAPFYGSYFNETIGFEWTADIIALLCLGYAVLYFAVGGGVEALMLTCRKPTKPFAAVNKDDDNFMAQCLSPKSEASRQSRTSQRFSFRSPSDVRSHRPSV